MICLYERSTRQREVLDALTSQGEELEAKVHEQEVQVCSSYTWGER